ncbi:MAG: AAA family ATPase [Fibrobacter sp.]|uniref:P-loop NTPase fold protein n=1 Tax=Fibrobacter sp. TaxID=35828 RepID=UPI001B2658C8|nr:P-loop NTPase fold protein [Fibrobacter sp.]MBO7059612.1 AAA family ATPase [Fibrobacter sp.]
MNEFVSEYCKKFIQSKNSPHFAILLKGDWGCGKTFFIKNLINSLKIDKEKYVYISLFGLKSLDQIDEKIFEAMHPLLSSPGVKIAGSLVKTALKLGADFKLDLSENGTQKKLFNIGVKCPSLKDVKKIRAKRDLLVVDDIERLGDGLEIKDVFGFFQDVISESDTKVIFVGNERKIENALDISDFSYKKIKEKSIGQEFLIKPCVNDAVDFFVEELNFKNPINEIVKRKALEIVENLKCENLRCVRSAIWNLNEYSDFITKDLEDGDTEKFISAYLLLSIQKSLNLIERDNVYDALKFYEKYKKAYELNEKEQMNFGFININIPLVNKWQEIIFDGLCSRDDLHACYYLEKEEIKNQNKKKKLFSLIQCWRDLDSADFERTVEEVNVEFENGMYLHPGEILHYANWMLLFSNWGIRSESDSSIEKKVKKLYATKPVKYIPDFDVLRMGFAGWSYSTDFPKFNIIEAFVREKNNELKAEHLKEDVLNSVHNLTNERIDEYCCDLWMCNGSNKYWKFPYFKYVNVDEVCEKLNKLTSKSLDFFLTSLEERYGLRYGSPADESAKEDVKNLRKIKTTYMKGKTYILNSPKNFLAQNFAKRFDNIISYIEQSRNGGR